MNRKILFQHWPFLLCFGLFVLLLARNPFSERSLIPNLEPYPDSFYYIGPALSMAKGHGYVLEREGRALRPVVPPMYSLVLTPAFVIFSDVRMFYVTNVILALLSFGLFYAICCRLFEQKSIRMMVLFLYSSCLILSWYASIPMAENVTLPLYLLGILLLINKTTRTRMVIAAAVGVSFYATKYASLSLSALYPVLYLVKCLVEVRQKKMKATELLWFCVALCGFASVYLSFEYVIQKNNIVGKVFSVFFDIVMHASSTRPDTATTVNPTQNVFFSSRFIQQNLNGYFGWFLGGKLNVLWNPTQILPAFLAIPAVVGFVIALKNPKQRAVALELVLLVLATVASLLVFYTTDGRYLYIAIPTLFLGFGFMLTGVQDLWQKYLPVKFFDLGVGVLLAIVLALNFSNLKYAILLNLRHAETPWYYISVKRLDSFIAQLPHDDSAQTPVVISPMPPYFIDFYTHSKMIILPLDPNQEFRSYPKEAWGDYDVTQLHKVYAQLLSEGHPVFVESYGLGNEKYLHAAFNNLSIDFVLTKKDDGCYTQCEIFELTEKPQQEGKK